MSLLRSDVPGVVSSMLDGRPSRWAPSNARVGDYDGAERSLDVFNAAAGDQRRLLRIVGSRRAEIELAAGGPVLVIFHTPEESLRLYADFLSEWGPIERSELSASVVRYIELSDALAWKQSVGAFDPAEIQRMQTELGTLLHAMAAADSKRAKEIVEARASVPHGRPLGLVDAAPGETLASKLREPDRTAA